MSVRAPGNYPGDRMPGKRKSPGNAVPVHRAAPMHHSISRNNQQDLFITVFAISGTIRQEAGSRILEYPQNDL